MIGAGDPKDLVAMCDVADRSELFDAVFTGDSLVAKRRIDAIVFDDGTLPECPLIETLAQGAATPPRPQPYTDSAASQMWIAI